MIAEAVASRAVVVSLHLTQFILLASCGEKSVHRLTLLQRRNGVSLVDKLTFYHIGFGDREERESRYPARTPVELPTRPPYTIHLGNIAFDTTDADVEGFFSESKVWINQDQQLQEYTRIHGLKYSALDQIVSDDGAGLTDQPVFSM